MDVKASLLANDRLLLSCFELDPGSSTDNTDYSFLELDPLDVSHHACDLESNAIARSFGCNLKTASL